MAQLPAELMCPLHTRANTLRSPPEVPRTVNANRNVKRSSPGSRLAAAGAAASRSRGTRRAIAGLGHGAKVGSVQETSGKSLEAQGGESWTANLHLFYIQIPVFIRALSLRDLGTATFQDFSCLEFAVVLSGRSSRPDGMRRQATENLQQIVAWDLLGCSVLQDPAKVVRFAFRARQALPPPPPPPANRSPRSEAAEAKRRTVGGTCQVSKISKRTSAVGILVTHQHPTTDCWHDQTHICIYVRHGKAEHLSEKRLRSSSRPSCSQDQQASQMPLAE